MTGPRPRIARIVLVTGASVTATLRPTGPGPPRWGVLAQVLGPAEWNLDPEEGAEACGQRPGLDPRSAASHGRSADRL